ncbi:unannotated protein [freshwater metagenome]|uniref:Unannotated protein n=1 Tax=freshwater metagenome TaxID=449393 RepID=A0A6J7DN77_9ZZZZ|nr:DUF222 domain-containing protein [Actinomycetota bacterium]
MVWEVVAVSIDDLADIADSAVDAFRGLRGYQRDQAFMDVERQIRRLVALQAAMLAEVTVSYSYLDDAHHTPVSWAQAVLNSSRSTAMHHTRLAAMLAELPALAAAAAAGHVGSDQLRLLAALHSNPRCGHMLAGSEELLLQHATTLSLGDFRQVCQRWLAHADPDGAHRDHELSRDQRSVKSTSHGAGHELRAQGDALTGDIINEIIDRHAAAELDNDIADRLAMYGAEADQHPLPRTARQRRYDALLAAMLKGASTGGSGEQEPLINIFTNEPTFNHAVRNYFGRDTADDFGDPGVSERLWMCQTASGAPVDPHDLVIAALLGHIRRVVTDNCGRVIDLGRKSRLFTGAAREAVLLGGDRCCWPGCGQRGSFIQIDHLAPWAGGGGGTTSPLNGAPMCATHNRRKHHGRFTVRRDADGWHHYRPDGSEIAPRTAT